MAQQEQSITEIMESIRRIMEKDAALNEGQTADPSQEDSQPKIEIDPPAAEEAPLLLTTPLNPDDDTANHDVLLLTDPLDPVPGTTDDPPAGQPEHAPESVQGDTGGFQLASPLTEAAVAAALTKLTSSALERSQSAPTDDSERAILEKVIRDALRPALRSWLDENLPPIIETIVEREVRRLMNEQKPT